MEVCAIIILRFVRMHRLSAMFACHMITRGMTTEHHVSSTAVSRTCAVAPLRGIVWFTILVCSNEMTKTHVFSKNFAASAG